ncbi:unnamed protein product [Owenia fusiformis]|uniref:Sushi, von Willebrand factor type A, EGF and pentraxin domain-containing protein 1 n=1 Tax=Owenia fusiformis TaxID=6347 RepID=A0A8S4NE52_OWEFU|nr:unnamed protein product [Owenia fusiformis]
MKPAIPFLIICACSIVTSHTDIINEGLDIVNEFYLRYNTTHEIDLVFILDRSNSVTADGWNAMVNFVKTLLQHFTVDGDNTRVAIITYSTSAVIDINDLNNDRENKCSLTRRIAGSIERKTPVGWTATYEALQKAYEILLNSRVTSKKAVFVLTDGKSNIGNPPVQVSYTIQSLKWDPEWNTEKFGPQAEIYAFGIKNADLEELKSIASRLPNHTFMIPNFQTFDRLARSLHGDKQEEIWTHVDGYLCQPRCSLYAECTCGTRTGQYHCVCKPGYEGDGITCKACKRGFFKEGLSPRSCVKCPSNSETPQSGASSLEECNCRRGFVRQSLEEPCIELFCPELPTVANSEKFYVRGRNMNEVPNTGKACSNTVEDSCHYECTEGYRLTGAPALVCGSDGSWEGNTPECQIVQCHTLKEIGEADPSAIITYKDGTTTFGSEVNIKCPIGMRAFGDETRICLQQGIWSGTKTHCVDISCPRLPKVQYGVIYPETCVQSSQRFGTECEYTCAPGFEVRGPSSRTCENNDKWTDHSIQTECIDVQAPVIECPANITRPADSGTDYAVIHWKGDEPRITDNSKYKWTVTPKPENKRFAIGFHLLKYTVTDSGMNSASCHRAIHVKGKSAKAHFCPESQLMEDVTTSSLIVAWQPPIFTDQDNKHISNYRCSQTSGTQFTIGKHNVYCQPLEHLDVVCHFTIELIAKTCVPLPPPVHGSVSCAPTGVYLQVCTVSCQENWDFFLPPANHYYCDRNGVWGSPDGTSSPPDCSAVNIPNYAIMQSEIEYFYYGGSCKDNADAIEQAFIKKAQEDPRFQCNLPSIECDLTSIRISCGIDSRRKRSITGSDDAIENIPIENSILGNVSCTNLTTGSVEGNETKIPICPSQSPEVVRTKLKLQFAIKAKIDGEVNKRSQFSLKRNLIIVTSQLDRDPRNKLNVDVDGVKLEAITYNNTHLEFITNCSAGQVTKLKMYEATCVNCPLGHFKHNATCLPCPINTFQDEEAKTSCKACPDGLKTIGTKSSSIDECLASCAPGEYSTTGLQPCDKCPFGKYQNAPGMTDCVQCPEGLATLTTGNSKVTDCQAQCSKGHFNATSGLEPCLPCPLHTYQSEKGKLECLDCPSNNETLVTGATSMDECIYIDHCLNVSCQNNGSCISIQGDAMCECSLGFTGPHCETNIDECLSSECTNNSTCVDMVNGYMCNCSTDTTGEFCEIQIGPCDSSPCGNQGSCLATGSDTYECFCQRGFNGTNCEVNIDDCEGIPCLYGNCYDLVDAFQCTCFVGYTAELCNVAIDYCLNDPCDNGGTCNNIENDFYCNCTEGYEGKRCEVELNECLSDPCVNGATCRNFPGGYTCDCQPLTGGVHCQMNLTSDYDLIFREGSVLDYSSLSLPYDLYALTLCLWLRSDDTKNYGTPVSYAVESNWLSADDTNTITLYDIGQLQLYVNGESVRTNISLNDGSWQHICVTWASGGGQWQIYINGTIMAVGSQLAAGTYIRGGGAFVLGQEQDGYERLFNPQEAFIGELTQVNVYDSVLPEESINDIANSTYCNMALGDVLNWPQFATGLNGNVEVRNGSFCLDVNECFYGARCGGRFVCEDLKGNFSCSSCKPGYEGKFCDQTVNKCSPNPCKNDAICTVSQEDDDFECHCLPGYTGRTCDYVLDPCLSNPCLANGTCVPNQDNSQYRCECPLPSMGPRCEPRCDSMECGPNGDCIDYQDHSECHCHNGYHGEYCELTQNACDSSPCHNGGQCHPTETGFECDCVGLWKGRVCNIEYKPNCNINPCLQGGQCYLSSSSSQGYECRCPDLPDVTWGQNCDIVNPCDSSPCINGGTCVRLPGRFFECGCNLPYTGPRCETLITTTTEATTTVVTTTEPTTTEITIPDFCSHVNCYNGGECTNEVDGFRCKCPLKFTGLYCKKEKLKEEFVYNVLVRLEMRYNPYLKHMADFKRGFSAAIHNVYAALEDASKIEVSINEVSKGSVLVDFDLIHTIYYNPDEVDFEKDDRPKTLSDMLNASLRSGQLGGFRASPKQYRFSDKRSPPATESVTAENNQDVGLYAALGVLCALILIAILFLTVVLVMRKRRQRGVQSMRKLNNDPPRIVNPIAPMSNPAYMRTDTPPEREPMLHSPTSPTEENIYADLDAPKPYCVSETKSDRSGPWRRQKDVNVFNENKAYGMGACGFTTDNQPKLTNPMIEENNKRPRYTNENIELKPLNKNDNTSDYLEPKSIKKPPLLQLREFDKPLPIPRPLSSAGPDIPPSPPPRTPIPPSDSPVDYLDFTNPDMAGRKLPPIPQDGADKHTYVNEDIEYVLPDSPGV